MHATEAHRRLDVTEAPRAVPPVRRRVSRAVDSTSYPHQDDTRAVGGGGGTGRGTMTFVTEDAQRPEPVREPHRLLDDEPWYGVRKRATIQMA